MVSNEHIVLSDFIKKTHEDLRAECKIIGAEKAWENHCTKRTNLDQYASAMKTLATKFWDSSIDQSRILWAFNVCSNYMNGEIVRFREKEVNIALKIKVDLLQSSGKSDGKKWNLLDVGSCYNPFQCFDCFNVTAVDIAPGAVDVKECDFLKVDINNITSIQGNRIAGLAKESFDFIIFSLLLEYLPSPKQRKTCCEKAYKLLKHEGLLIIITPDSNHVGHNTKYFKSWQFVLATMGFSRIKYEKLKHLHCMAFRKALSSEISKRWVDLHKDKQVYDDMYIPQDFKKHNDLFHDEENTINTTSSTVGLNFSKNLPFYDDIS